MLQSAEGFESPHFGITKFMGKAQRFSKDLSTQLLENFTQVPHIENFFKYFIAFMTKNSYRKCSDKILKASKFIIQNTFRFTSAEHLQK